MFVTTAIAGESFRNDRSLSSASTTMYWPRPRRALLPNALSRPPMTAVGSSPARSSISATIDVVVVLPCAPATAMPTRRRISSASISARGMTGTCRARASATSGLSAAIADDTTTTSASPTWRRVVAGHDADAERREPIGDVGSASVGSADLVAEVHEQLGDATHADAADPDEMHAPRAAEPHDSTSRSSPAPAPAELAARSRTMRARGVRPREPAHRRRHRLAAVARSASKLARHVGQPFGASDRARRSRPPRPRPRAPARSCAGGRRSPPETE